MLIDLYLEDELKQGLSKRFWRSVPSTADLVFGYHSVRPRPGRELSGSKIGSEI